MGKITRSELSDVLNDELDGMGAKQGEILTGVQTINTNVETVKTDVAGVKTDVASVKTDVAGVSAKQDIVLNKLENTGSASSESPLKDPKNLFKHVDAKTYSFIRGFDVSNAIALNSNFGMETTSFPIGITNNTSITNGTIGMLVSAENSPLDFSIKRAYYQSHNKVDFYYDDGYYVSASCEYSSTGWNRLYLTVIKTEIVDGVMTHKTLLNYAQNTISTVSGSSSTFTPLLLRDGNKIAVLIYYGSISDSASRMYSFDLPTQVSSSVTVKVGTFDFGTSVNKSYTISDSYYKRIIYQANKIQYVQKSSSNIYWVNISFDAASNSIKFNSPTYVVDTSILGNGLTTYPSATYGATIGGIPGDDVLYTTHGYIFIKSTSHDVYKHAVSASNSSFAHFGYNGEVYYMEKYGTYAAYIRKVRYNNTIGELEVGKPYCIETTFTPGAFCISTYMGKPILVGTNTDGYVIARDITEDLAKVPNIGE